MRTRQHDASGSLGSGVDSPRVHRSAKVSAVRTESNTTPGNPGSTWSDIPTVLNQIGMEGAWRPSKKEVKVFDLSKEADLKAYNEILVKTSDPATNVIIVEEVKQFSEKSDNWKVFITLQYIEFKKLTNAEKGKTSAEAE